MKTKNIFKIIVVLILATLFLSSCFSKNEEKILENENISKKENVSKKIETKIQNKKENPLLAEYLEAKWLNRLDNSYKFDDVKETEKWFEYNFWKGKNENIQKKLVYKKDSKWNYTGEMTISFPKNTTSHILHISKSFASDVSQLDFSVKPSKIINPDPIVEFENPPEKILAKSKETKTEEEIKKSLEEQIIETELKNCENLEKEKAISCTLWLISKYRDSKYLQQKLEKEKLNLAGIEGALVYAVLRKGIHHYCSPLMDDEERDLCYEYAYQTLVKDCDSKKGKEYRNCVRHYSSELWSLKERRLFCDYITDEEMKKECNGTAPLKVCDEIEDIDERDLCQLNILRTKNDPKECEKLKDPIMRDACFAVIGVYRWDKNICNKIKDEYNRWQCLTKVAMEKNDKDICLQITDKDSKSLCNSYFVIVKWEVSKEMCKDTHELFLKEMCEMVLAVKEKNCEKKEVTFNLKPYCYSMLALKTNDLNACEKIDDITEHIDKELFQIIKGTCYSNIAAMRKDVSICKKIKIPKLKKDCEKAIKEKLEEKEKAEYIDVKCENYSNSVCPKLSDKKAKIILKDGDHNIECIYYRSAGKYPLYKETYKLWDKKDGTQKVWYQKSNREKGRISYTQNWINLYSEFKNNIAKGLSFHCDSKGNMVRCFNYKKDSRWVTRWFDCMKK